MASLHILAAVVATRQFANVGMEVLSSIIHLLGVSILSYMLAMKLKLSDIRSFQFNHISWPRLLVVLNFIDSWAFLFTTGVLVHGTGMELSGTVCVLGILNCIVFYTTSKILIYLFLAEKVYVVWNGRRKRFRSKVYIGCLAVILAYVGVIAVLVVGRIAHFRDKDGACVIGLTRAASLTLLIYDLLINVLLTSLFVWPLLDRGFSAALKKVAVRTVWAAAVALTTSCINILVLTLMHGQQLAWVCLASCGTDVVINAIVLCWVTSGQSEHGSEHSQDPSSHGDPSKGFTSNIVLYSATASEFPGDVPRSAGVRGRFPRIFRSGSKAPGRPRASSAPLSMKKSASKSAVGTSSHTHTHTHTHGDVEMLAFGPSSSFVTVGKDLENASLGEETEEDVEERPRGPVSPPPLPSTPTPTTLIRPPTRTHSSTVRRANTALSRHGASPGEPGALQIIITRETEMVADDIPEMPFGSSSSASGSPPEDADRKMTGWFE